MSVKSNIFGKAAAAIAIVAVLAGCAKTEVTDRARVEIGFRGRIVSQEDWAPLATKSSYLDGGNELPASSQFGVYAYDTGTATWATAGASAKPEFMTNVPVSYNGNGVSEPNNYTYSPLQYWPAGDTPDKLTFYAYYPYTASAGTSGITSLPSASTTGLGTFGLTVDATPANQVDLMLTDVFADQLYETNSGVVPFVFYHMLTQVIIKVKASSALSGTSVSMEGFTINGVAKDGVLTVDTPATNSSWAISGSLPVAFSSSVPLSTTETTLATMHLLPQGSISGTISADISYKITTTTPARTIEQTATAIDLSKGDTISWDMGHKVVYTFTVGVDNIEFSADASAWTSETSVIIVE